MPSCAREAFSALLHKCSVCSVEGEVSIVVLIYWSRQGFDKLPKRLQEVSRKTPGIFMRDFEKFQKRFQEGSKQTLGGFQRDSGEFPNRPQEVSRDWRRSPRSFQRESLTSFKRDTLRSFLRDSEKFSQRRRKVSKETSRSFHRDFKMFPKWFQEVFKMTPRKTQFPERFREVCIGLREDIFRQALSLLKWEFEETPSSLSDFLEKSWKKP